MRFLPLKSAVFRHKYDEVADIGRKVKEGFYILEISRVKDIYADSLTEKQKFFSGLLICGKYFRNYTE